MGCNSCGCRSCSCGSSGQKPYYETDSCLSENCEGKVYVCNYQPIVRVQGEWAVPEADQVVTLTLPALADILIGSVLWNPDYGSYLVVAYDGYNQVKVVKGDDNEVANGTSIPSCSKFVVTIPVIPVVIPTDPEYQTWEPEYEASDSMTYTDVDTLVADYIELREKHVGFNLVASGETGGVASNEIRFGLPVTPAADGVEFSASIEIAGSRLAATAVWDAASSLVLVRYYDESNITLTTDVIIRVSGQYKAA